MLEEFPFREAAILTVKKKKKNSHSGTVHRLQWLSLINSAGVLMLQKQSSLEFCIFNDVQFGIYFFSDLF